MEPEVYVRFLLGTIQNLTRQGPDGRAYWASDRDIIAGYFQRLRDGSEDVEALSWPAPSNDTRTLAAPDRAR